MLVIATIVAELGAARADLPPTPWLPLVAYPALVLSVFVARGTYTNTLRVSLIDQLRVVATTTALVAMVVVSLRVFVAADPAVADPAVAQQGARLWAFSLFYVGGWRALSYVLQQRARRRGENLQPTLIVGAGRIGQVLAQRLLERPEFGLKPIGFLDKAPLVERPLGLPVLGASWDLERVVREHSVEHVAVCFSTAPVDVLLRLLEHAQRLGVEASFVPRLYERTTSRLSVQHIGGLPLLSAHQTDPAGFQFALKYAFDRLAAAVMIVLLAPGLAVVALAVWLDLGRPLLFRQERIGRDGRSFEILKFRSMRGSQADDDADAFAAFGLAPGGVEGEDRRSVVGTLIRRTSLDELPQLFNVLRGDMTLIGPRPERPEFVSRFAHDIRRYDQRHRVKSGITGWAQVHDLRGKTSVADRAEWDNYYIENFSLWLDFKIMLLTFAAVIRGARSVE
ncbi:MAG TPA: sugar transferase [Gaiellaceae bacterium]|nr:sugar transferase [Gaiellaceae bacterium]